MFCFFFKYKYENICETKQEIKNKVICICINFNFFNFVMDSINVSFFIISIDYLKKKSHI